MVALKSKFVLKFWQRDGFISHGHYLIAKRGREMRRILTEDDADHELYELAKRAEKHGLVKPYPKEDSSA